MELSLNDIQKFGYLNFNLKDFDLELYNELEEIYDKKIFKSHIDSCRVNLTLSNISDDKFKEILEKNFFGSHGIHTIPFDDGIHININTLSDPDDVNNLIDDLSPYTKYINQRWKYGILQNIENNKLTNISSKIIKKVGLSLYRNEYNIDLLQFNTSELTLYTDGDFITPHEDGIDTNRLCVILVYLNKDYESKFGGELVINENEFVEPKFGEVVVLDFTKNNLKHSVNKVKSKTFERYTLIKFLKII